MCDKQIIGNDEYDEIKSSNKNQENPGIASS